MAYKVVFETKERKQRYLHVVGWLVQLARLIEWTRPNLSCSEILHFFFKRSRSEEEADTTIRSLELKEVEVETVVVTKKKVDYSCQCFNTCHGPWIATSSLVDPTVREIFYSSMKISLIRYLDQDADALTFDTGWHCAFGCQVPQCHTSCFLIIQWYHAILLSLSYPNVILKAFG